MTRIEVCPVADLDEGDRRIVETKGVSIGVFNIDGQYYALLNTCLHQRGPVCEGKLLAEFTAEHTGIGEWVHEYYSDRTVVKCPWHGWEYFVDTGEVVGHPTRSLPTYEVVVDDGMIYLET